MSGLPETGHSWAIHEYTPLVLAMKAGTTPVIYLREYRWLTWRQLLFAMNAAT
jgi:hypothetical protein